MCPVFLQHPVVTIVNSAVWVVLICSAFIEHSIQTQTAGSCPWLGLELGTLVKGSVNAASSSEGLDSGIDAHVISPTAWFLELYVQVSRVLTHGFCFIDADGQKQLQPSKPSLLLRLISKRKKEGF